MNSSDSPSTSSPANTQRQKGWRSGDIAGLIVLAIIIITLIVTSRPAINSGQIGPRTKCLNNIRNIAFAVLMYERDHGTLPPAYVADKQGRPLYSWRVLILPYLDEAALYREFHLDEPWDSPHNKPLSDKVINVFRCPDGDDEPTCTNYFVVVGPKMAWTGSETTPLSDITDAAERTILLVEAADMGIHWAEPRDLNFNQIPMVLNPKPGLGISSHHRGGVVMVALANASARSLSPDLEPDLLRRLLEINDRETVEDLP